MSDSITLSTDDITGVILAGGKGRRMGGRDKGLMKLYGRPLAAHIAERLSPQVGRLILNANRNPDGYAALGYPVVPDMMGDFDGPLVGLASAMDAADTPLVLTVPCDSPRLPANLAARLLAALQERQVDIALAHDGERTQQVFALYKRQLYPALRAYLDGGGRQVRAWLAGQNSVPVDFSDCPDAFLNVNTPEEWAVLTEKFG